MPFSAPDSELITDDPSQGRGSRASSTPVTTASGGFVAPESDVLNEQGHTPVEAAHAYLDAAGDGLPASVDRSLSWQDQAEQHYQAGKAYWDQNPLQRLEASAAGTLSDLRHHPLATAGHAWDATSGAVGNLYQRAKQGTADAWSQATQDFHEHPFLAPAHLLASVTVGGLEGLYGLGKLGAEAIGKVSDAAADASPATLVDPEAAGRYRATRDYLLRRYNQDVEAPTRADIREASPLPAVQDAAEVVAPALVPMGEAGIVAKGADMLAGTVPKVGGRILQGTGKAVGAVADNARVLSAVDALRAINQGGFVHAAGDALAAVTAAKVLRPFAPKMEALGQSIATSGPSATVRQIAAPVLQAGLRTGTALATNASKPVVSTPWIAPESKLVAENE